MLECIHQVSFIQVKAHTAGLPCPQACRTRNCLNTATGSHNPHLSVSRLSQTAYVASRVRYTRSPITRTDRIAAWRLIQGGARIWSQLAAQLQSLNVSSGSQKRRAHPKPLQTEAVHSQQALPSDGFVVLGPTSSTRHSANLAERSCNALCSATSSSYAPT